MKMFATICAVVVFSSSVFAQITITRSDYDQMIGIASSTSYDATDASGKTFDIGGTGHGLSWDFTGFAYTSEVTNNPFVDPTTTTYTTQFPNATHAVPIDGQDGNSFLYIKLNDNGFFQDGMAGIYQGQQLLMDYIPDKPEVLFPATLNSAWNYTGDPIEFAGGSYTQETRTQSEIDGSGTLVLPGGQYDCLRLRTTEWQTTKVVVGGQVVSSQVYKSVSYDFLTKSGVGASIIADSSSPLDGTITVEDVSYTVFGGQVGVGDVPAMQDFSVRTAYPNPVAGGEHSTISWNVPSSAAVSVKLYTVHGVEAATLYNGEASQGVYTQTINTAGLSPGMYFIRLTSGNHTSAKALTIVR